ncbi:SMP-30/gluconolactonase/LRE family protein [Dongia sp. agr-C8]
MDETLAAAPAASKRSASRYPFEALVKWRARLVPSHVLGEIMSKQWIDSAVPATFMVLVIGCFMIAAPGFFTGANISDGGRQLGEFGLVALGMMIVIMGGGIDLSVGSIFALGNFTALALSNLFDWPVIAILPCVIAVCAFAGLINGILVGYFRLRAFLTTLVSLITIRALVDVLLLEFAVDISAGFYDSTIWDFAGMGSPLGIPTSLVVLIVVAIAIHLFLSRSRLGWHVMAVGGSRRSAHNVGISVKRTVCFTYVLSGALAGLAAFLYAARLGNGGSYPGAGMEIFALTAVIVGGTSLGGGRGSVAKALMGSIIVLMINLGVVQMGLQSGAGQLVLGLILLLAIAIDVRFIRNREKILSRLYMSPTYFRLPEAPDAEQSASPYARNDRLADVSLIGLGRLDGAEDVIFDANDHLYCGDRLGNIVRFDAPDYKEGKVFAHIGGHPLGLAFDPAGVLYVCVGGMGLYRVHPDGRAEKATDQTNRSPFSIIDDSRMRLADDLDIAPDGRVFFSEATTRYDMETWPADALESRGSGRIVCYDPAKNTTRTVLRRLVFPNGVCAETGGQSLLFAESWACRISRYWFAGPREGQVERVIENLPGYPDNINRASDGNYWVALMGMRSPALDLALRMPDFRRRMALEVAPDEWLYPNINAGCVVKISGEGKVLETLWDLHAENHPMITSMREHKGALYLGGILNNRIGKHVLAKADPAWSATTSYWGKA